MNAPLEYKGYIGSADVDFEDRVLVGRLLFIRDVITYSAHSVGELELAFREAVDEYLATCAADGSEPEQPCKGSFNVRVGAARHRAVALAARSMGIGLNDLVSLAIDDKLRASSPQTVLHKHEVSVSFVGEAPLTGFTGEAAKWTTVGDAPKH